VSTHELILPLLVLAIVTHGIAFLLGQVFEWSDWRNDMVKRGFAEYYLDENNVRQWRWKQPPGGE
jgi:hypothetical protein